SVAWMPPHSEQIVSRICGALFRGSLARFLDRGSHRDGINITVMDFNHYDLNYYFDKFRAVFDAAGFPEHYAANMGAETVQLPA
ncbi:hypothetical protein BRN92_02695, partial [Xanthomonas oryzae pv. oryzae]